MQKFHGQITTSTPRKVQRIWEAKHITGKYGDQDEHGSRITVWVPTPRHGEHKPGIFIRLSNPSGSAYARLTGEEFADLYSFLRHIHRPATEAYAQAEEFCAIYSEAERALLKARGHVFTDEVDDQVVDLDDEYDPILDEDYIQPSTNTDGMNDEIQTNIDEINESSTN